MENKDTDAPEFQRLYICSPYRGESGKPADIEMNVQLAQIYCRQIVKRYPKAIPIAPHIYLTQFLNDDDPAQREAGLAMGRALLAICQVVLVFGDQVSEGMKAEILEAARLNIPVCYGYAATVGHGAVLMSEQFWRNKIGIPAPSFSLIRERRMIDPVDFERFMMFKYPHTPGNQNADIDDDSLRIILDAAHAYAQKNGVAVDYWDTPKQQADAEPAEDPAETIKAATKKSPRQIGRGLALAYINARNRKRAEKEARRGKK